MKDFGASVIKCDEIVLCEKAIGDSIEELVPSRGRLRRLQWNGIKVRINLLHKTEHTASVPLVANPARVAEYFSRLADREANATSSSAFRK
jgi:hypothetical protein